MTDLDAIRARDKESGATWFTGPASFTAQAARDRRALLQELDARNGQTSEGSGWVPQSAASLQCRETPQGGDRAETSGKPVAGRKDGLSDSVLAVGIGFDEASSGAFHAWYDRLPPEKAVGMHGSKLSAFRAGARWASQTIPSQVPKQDDGESEVRWLSVAFHYAGWTNTFRGLLEDAVRHYSRHGERAPEAWLSAIANSAKPHPGGAPNPPPPEGNRPPPPPAPPRADGRPARSYPLQAPTAVMVKLGSIAVHVEEMLSLIGHDFDRIALQALLDDPEIKEWLAAMDKLAFLPRKR